jgi:hypothetical protein
VPQSSFDDKQIGLIFTQNGIAFKAEGKFVEASDEARCKSEAKQMERYRPSTARAMVRGHYEGRRLERPTIFKRVIYNINSLL